MVLREVHPSVQCRLGGAQDPSLLTCHVHSLEALLSLGSTPPVPAQGLGPAEAAGEPGVDGPAQVPLQVYPAEWNAVGTLVVTDGMVNPGPGLSREVTWLCLGLRHRKYH